MPESAILLIDDNTSLRVVSAAVLKLAGFTVAQASSGPEGLALLAAQRFDAVISDVEMPGMDGFEVCVAIKKLGQICPVALLTSHVSHAFLLKGIEAGADLYITRPVENTLLQELAGQLVSMNPRMPAGEQSREVVFEGNRYSIPIDPDVLVGLLLQAYRASVSQNRRLQELKEAVERSNAALAEQKKNVERLLMNTMPKDIAVRLVNAGFVEPELKDGVAVLFTDFVHFTRTAALETPERVLSSLDHYFEAFGQIAARFGLERIKTIGDSYMAVCGVPNAMSNAFERAFLAGMEMLDFVRQAQKQTPEELLVWDVRIGIETGPVIAGIIGTDRLAYDVWGDTVNRASRLESFTFENTVGLSDAGLALVERFVEYETFRIPEFPDQRFFAVSGFITGAASLTSREIRTLLVPDLG